MAATLAKNPVLATFVWTSVSHEETPGAPRMATDVGQVRSSSSSKSNRARRDGVDWTGRRRRADGERDMVCSYPEVKVWKRQTRRATQCRIGERTLGAP